MDDFVATDHRMFIVSVYVNSFQLGAKWRHDCLLKLDDPTIQHVEEYRKRTVAAYFGDIVKKFSMNPPHITAGIHWTKEDAQRHVDSINQILLEKGPRQVEIVGLTI